MTRAIEHYSRRTTAVGMPPAITRKEIEDLVERLIACLDIMDGDTDREDDSEDDDCDMESYLADDFGGQSLEDGDDNGVADHAGLMDQEWRFAA